MELRGLGDRWLAGETIPGVGFSQHARVAVVGGRHDGDVGTVLLLLTPPPDPMFLVRLDGAAEPVKLRQELLRESEGG